MLLSILIIVLLALIALFHYVQGLFAATISAVCAALAAFMAFSYHEWVIAEYAAENLGSYGAPVALVVLFAVVYTVLRFMLDNLMPGNVRYPVALDRIGAPVMGLIAGFFATAIIAIAAQELPFGTRVMFYSPYETEDTEYAVDRTLSSLYRLNLGDDASNYNQLTIQQFGTDEAEEARQSLLIPVDDWFLALVGKLSNQGSLAGPSDFRTVYPDFKTAIFGQRLGMQRSATQVAYTVGDQQQFGLRAIYRPGIGGEGSQFPEGIVQVPGDLGPNRTAEEFLRAKPGHTLLIVRVDFKDQSMADRGGYVRFAPSAARLVIAGKQYFPIATLESGEVAVHHKPDDYLLAQKGADLIYEVETASALAENKLASNAFLEFKEFARVDLGGQEVVDTRIPKSASTHVLRKIPVQLAISTRLARTDPNAPGGTVGFEQLRASVPDEGEETPPEVPAATQPDTPLDVIRGGVDRRNQELQGDDGAGEGGASGGTGGAAGDGAGEPE